MTTNTIKKRKKCPNGTRKNKNTGRCIKIKGKRCPNGTRKNKDTGKCESKYDTKIKSPTQIKSIIKTRKVCPPNKPLYNPKTNRCVLDSEVNRKKLGQIEIKDTIKDTIKKKEQVRKVCPPNKPLYNPKTNRCVLDSEVNRKKLGQIEIKDTIKDTIKKKEQVRKVCPPNKPLYNPKTNRCLMNTMANMKKLGLEFSQKPDDIEQTKKYKKFDTKINLDFRKADLLENFNKVTDNIWQGNMYKILMGMYYVLSRHSNVCFLSGEIDTPRKRVDFEKFNIIYIITTKRTFDFSNKYGNLNDSEILSKKEYELMKKQKGKKVKTKMIEYMSVSKGFNLKKNIENCKKNNKRFAIGLIYLLNREKNEAHENSYIYDIEKHELEIFEPNGGDVNDIKELFNVDNFYSEFLEYFKKNKIPVKRFYKPINYCPIGPQYNDSYSTYLIQNAPSGYCAAWSIYYLDARLSNPNIPRDLLITTMNIKFRNESAVFINSYSTFIIMNFLNNVLDFDKLKNKYPTFLKNFNEGKLTKPQRIYLNEQLIKEIDTLISSM